MSPNLHHCSILTAMMTAGGLALAASAATIPHTETFEDGVADGFNPSPSDSWSVGANAVLDGMAYTNSTGGGTNSSAIQFTDIDTSGATSFHYTASYDFVINSYTPNNVQGFTLDMGWYVGSTNGTDSPVYLMDFMAEGDDFNNQALQGRMRIHELGGDAQIAAGAFNGGGNLTVGARYTTTIDVAYDAGSGDLSLTLTLSDGVNSDSINAVDSTPQLGGWLALRNRSNVTASNISFDNFQVVPEPASLALLGLGATVVFGRRCNA